MQTSEGVVLAVEKRISSSLLEPSSIEKIVEIDAHIGCAMSGLVPDSRTMIDHARVEAQVLVSLPINSDGSAELSVQNHWFTYNESIKVESVTQAVCDLALRFGEGAEGESAVMVPFFFTSWSTRSTTSRVVHLVATLWCCLVDRWCR